MIADKKICKTLDEIKPDILNYFFLLVMLLSAISGFSQQERERPEHARNLYWRAPDVFEGTLPEMRTADYWINQMDAPDKVILDVASIQRMNDDYERRMEAGLDSVSMRRLGWQLRSRPGMMTYTPEFGGISPEQASQLAKETIEKQATLLDRGSYGNKLAVEYGKSELESFKSELALSEVPEAVNVQLGLTISKTLLRIVPSLRDENIGMSNNGKSRWDMWNLDVLELGESVQVIHKSASKGFLLVVTDKGIGWVRSEQIALGEENEINNWINAEDFIVATGESVPFYSDKEASLVSGWMGMSTRMAYKKGNPRIVLVPTRKIDGSLDIQEAWLKEGADVSVGYLPYTKKNVISQAIKLLDLAYDWTGGWYGRNHATILADLFGSFGFDLPSNGVLLSMYTSSPNAISPEIGMEKQMDAIRSNDPFTTIQISNSGHSQLFIGVHEGMPIVFDTSGYGYEDADGNEFEYRRSVIGTVEIPDYMLKQDMTFIELK